MIVFEYQCPKCKYIRGEYRNHWEDTSVAVHPCQLCDIPMPKIMSAPKGYVTGTDTPVKFKSSK